LLLLLSDFGPEGVLLFGHGGLEFGDCALLFYDVPVFFQELI